MLFARNGGKPRIKCLNTRHAGRYSNQLHYKYKSRIYRCTSVVPTKYFHGAVFLSPYVLHNQPIPVFLIVSLEQYLARRNKFWSSSLFTLLYSSVPSSLLGPNTFYSKIFSNTLGLYSFLSVTDQILHRTGKIIVLYISIVAFFYSKLEDRLFLMEW